MTKSRLKITTAALALLLAIPACPAFAKSKAKSNSTKVIYTGEIGKKIYGYNGTTPLNIHISDGKIEKIEALDNQESPAYFKKATSHVFPQFTGKTVEQALKVNADAATGATYSSEALIKNIKLGLQQANTTTKKAKKSKKSKKSKGTRK